MLVPPACLYEYCAIRGKRVCASEIFGDTRSCRAPTTKREVALLRSRIPNLAVHTGWRYVLDREYMRVPRIHLYNLYLLLAKQPVRTALFLCSDNECYPLPLGLFPTDNHLEEIARAFGLDVVSWLQEEAGVKSIKWLFATQATEAAIRSSPGLVRVYLKLPHSMVRELARSYYWLQKQSAKVLSHARMINYDEVLSSIEKQYT